MKIDIIAGARPNFMKIAPIIDAIELLEEKTLSYRIIHTGQHYDKKMSGDFFEQLGIPEPHINLEAGGGTQAEQTANIMIRYEKVLLKEPCDLCLVVGDVTSTMACAVTAKKLNIKVAHIEAGIRSNDLSMPEEINRLVTDSISDFFYTTSLSASNNLRKAGNKNNQILFVGNTMIDSLLKHLPKFKRPFFFEELKLCPKKYFVLTLHRPSNVDDPEKLKKMIVEIIENSNNYPLIFPIHPRTAKIFTDLGIKASNLHLVEPLSYLEFNYLVKNSFAVITDSGGITEETTVLEIPCLTLRDNTERPETVEIGTNELVGTNPENIKQYLHKLFTGNWKRGSIPKYWDGKTAHRIVKHLLILSQNV